MKTSFYALRAWTLAAAMGAVTFSVAAPSLAKPKAPLCFDPYASQKRGLAYQILPVQTTGKETFLAGRVVDEKGQPIVGATVDAYQWYPGAETKTNAKGEFTLKSTKPEYGVFEAGEKIEVTFSAPGYSPRYVAVQPLGTLKSPLVLRRDTFIEGLVQTADGQPVAGAKVRAVAGPFYGDGVQITEVPYSTTSDAKGHYKLFLQSGKYELFVRGAQGVSRTPPLVLTAKTRLEKNFTVQAGATFRARVVDSLTGEPVAGLKLLSSSDYQGTSDKNGEISVANMYDGPFTWYVQGQGISRWWSEQATRDYQRKTIEKERGGWQRNFDNLDFDIAKGMEPVTIVAERSVRIRGRVLSPSGQPVAGATVDPALTGTGNSLTGDTRFSVKTDAKGHYDGNFPAGNGREWNLTAHDGDYGQWRNFANATSAPLQTKPGQSIENYDLKLQPIATFTGKVRETKRASPSRAPKCARCPLTGTASATILRPTRTDAKGNFTLRYVAAGPHYVQVEPFWLSAKEAPKASTKIVEAKVGKATPRRRLDASAQRLNSPYHLSSRTKLSCSIALSGGEASGKRGFYCNLILSNYLNASAIRRERSCPDFPAIRLRRGRRDSRRCV